MKKISILGIRGIPASHGGFETFAEYLSLYLKESGWEVDVYCQKQGTSALQKDEWRGINLISLFVRGDGALSTIIFDFKSIFHACLNNKSVHLTLGYNTGFMNIAQRLFRIKNVINMDGIEWKRQKWGSLQKVWLWINERMACWFGNHLVADHPEIKNHLCSRVSQSKVTMIPYGAPSVISGDVQYLSQYNIEPNNYAVIIARPEPENSIYEIVKAFTLKKRKGKLLILGNYRPEENDYHAKVLSVANTDVIFVGAIYDANIVQSIRLFSRFYIHGHQVGGTNPSLVESLGSGNAVLAHDNKYNRWVAKSGACYFTSENDLSVSFDKLFSDDAEIERLKKSSRNNFENNFQWNSILEQYQDLLNQYG